MRGVAFAYTLPRQIFLLRKRLAKLDHLLLLKLPEQTLEIAEIALRRRIAVTDQIARRQAGIHGRGELMIRNRVRRQIVWLEDSEGQCLCSSEKTCRNSHCRLKNLQEQRCEVVDAPLQPRPMRTGLPRARTATQPRVPFQGFFQPSSPINGTKRTAPRSDSTSDPSASFLTLTSC